MKAGVVIVNFESAELALDAALSVLGDDADVRVVIVDNGSTDGSIAYFEKVFGDRFDHAPKRPSEPPVDLRFAGLEDIETIIVGADEAPRDARLVVLAAGRNRGFAAGCNLGMRFLAATCAPDWFLLLNPDALVAHGSMAAFAARLRDPAAGLCGASILRFDAPHEVQAFGGASLHPLTLQGRNLGAGTRLGAAPSTATLEARLDYPLGAAMALRADYLDRYGGLDERYFLYYEEADWARRARGRHDPVWARDAVVYHRHGAAAGSRLRARKRSPLADFHMARSRMLYALKWRPWLAPMILALSFGQMLTRLLRGHFAQAGAVVSGSASPAKSSVPKFFS